MDEYGKARVKLHNAQKHFEAIEKKHRKRLGRIESMHLELAQLESGLPALAEKLRQAKDDVKAAKDVYRPLRHEHKESRNPGR
jgi:predicted  nucleic acid-binding Zn-ribbon protein